MGNWHETMMRSSASFRECHENGGMGNESGSGAGSGCECPERISYHDLLDKPFGGVRVKELVNDYVSITKQPADSKGHIYWWLVCGGEALEVGKHYEIIFNDERYVLECQEIDGKPTLNGLVECPMENLCSGIVLKYNPDNGMYLLSYYPLDVDNMVDNPTVNFELHEIVDHSLMKIKIELNSEASKRICTISYMDKVYSHTYTGTYTGNSHKYQVEDPIMQLLLIHYIRHHKINIQININNTIYYISQAEINMNLGVTIHLPNNGYLHVLDMNV